MNWIIEGVMKSGLECSIDRSITEGTKELLIGWISRIAR